MPSSIRLLKMLNPKEKKNNNNTTSPLDELSESDVVWSSPSIESPPSSPTPTSPVVQRKKTTIISPPLSRSAPMKVPIWTQGRSIGRMERFEEEEKFEDEDDEEEMVPPHEMVARSHRATTFSVVEGAGRTLKGRDLSAVRTALMQRTGFVD